MVGGCLCGSVRFSAEGVDPNFEACHCGMCRRWCGGAPLFSTFVDKVVFEGSDAIGRFASSAWAERGFCTRCGTVLFYYFKPANKYGIAVGAFDDPSPFVFSREAFVDRKSEAYDFAGHREQTTEAEMLAKLAEVRARRSTPK